MKLKEKYTVSEATELLGFKSRSTINRRTKTTGNNSISFEKDEDGNKIIRFVELQRAFPDRVKSILANQRNTTNTITAHSAKIQSNTARNTPNALLLQHKIENLELQLEKEKEERLRERREATERDSRSENREQLLQQQVTELTKTLSQQTKLLEDHRKPSEKVNSVKPSLASEVKDVLKTFILAVFIVSALIAIVYVFA
jgi:Skp family chaperone for outer membrane proteins